MKNKFVIENYSPTSRLTDEMLQNTWLVKHGFIDENHKPTKCKTCGGDEIIEIEYFLPKGVPLEEFAKKGKKAFTGEMEFTIYYRCSGCDSCEGMVYWGKNLALW